MYQCAIAPRPDAHSKMNTTTTSANLHDSEYALISAYQHTQTSQARSAQKVFAAHGSEQMLWYSWAVSLRMFNQIQSTQKYTNNPVHPSQLFCHIFIELLQMPHKDTFNFVLLRYIEQ